MMNYDDIDCIVIGTGVSGIAAAIQLSQSKKKVLVLEATSYIGGRARSFIDTKTGEIIDNGQHAMMGCYANFLSLLHTLGTNNLLHKQKSLSVPFVYPDGNKDILKVGGKGGAIGIAYGIWNLSSISLSEKLSALYFACRLKIGLTKPGSMTATEYLLSERQSYHIIEVLWKPIILATLNGHPDHVAATLLVTVLSLAFLGNKDSSTLILPTVGLSELFAPFPHWLHQHGGECLFGESVEELILNNDTITGVLTKSGRAFLSTNIIAAIPPKAVMRILPNQLRNNRYFQTLNEYQYSPIISVYLWIDTLLPQLEFAAMLGTTTQWVFHKNSFTNNIHSTTLLSCTVSAGIESLEQSSEAIVRTCLQELQLCFPELSSAQLIHSKVIKERYATFLATPEMENKRVSVITPVDGLYLAGDWTNTKLPATLEGAAFSGYNAAKALTAKSTVFSHS